jgi:hypothetical protein
MIDQRSQELINTCQFWSFLKLPIHWDKETKQLIVFPPFCEELAIWNCCIIVASFGTLSSMFVNLTQLMNRNSRISPLVVLVNVLMVFLGSYVVFLGCVFLNYAKHTAFFWVNLRSFKFDKQQSSI